MPDLIPDRQSQLNEHYPQAAPSVPLGWQSHQQLTPVPTPDETSLIENTETKPEKPEPYGMNSLEKLVLVIALILLCVAVVNAGIVVYRFEHQNQQELQQ